MKPLQSLLAGEPRLWIGIRVRHVDELDALGAALAAIVADFEAAERARTVV